MRLGFNPLSDSTLELVKCQLGYGQASISKNNCFDSLVRHAVRAGKGGVRLSVSWPFKPMCLSHELEAFKKDKYLLSDKKSDYSVICHLYKA